MVIKILIIIVEIDKQKNTLIYYYLFDLYTFF